MTGRRLRTTEQRTTDNEPRMTGGAVDDGTAEGAGAEVQAQTRGSGRPRNAWMASVSVGEAMTRWRARTRTRTRRGGTGARARVLDELLVARHYAAHDLVRRPSSFLRLQRGNVRAPQRPRRLGGAGSRARMSRLVVGQGGFRVFVVGGLV